LGPEYTFRDTLTFTTATSRIRLLFGASVTYDLSNDQSADTRCNMQVTSRGGVWATVTYILHSQFKSQRCYFPAKILNKKTNRFYRLHVHCLHLEIMCGLSSLMCPLLESPSNRQSTSVSVGTIASKMNAVADVKARLKSNKSLHTLMST